MRYPATRERALRKGQIGGPAKPGRIRKAYQYESARKERLAFPGAVKAPLMIWSVRMARRRENPIPAAGLGSGSPGIGS